MKPLISTKGKLAQLRYELPHRVHDSKVYPVKAPNGSTIILYAHDSGVGVVWRGGRPLKQSLPPPKQPAKPQKVNGTSDAIMIIDSDDDDAPSQATAPPPPAVEFEDDEEELDPDAPYPSIIQKLRLSLNTEVLHLAVPQIPAASTLRTADSVPSIFSKKIIFTVACADYSVRIVTLPLTPPPNPSQDGPLSAKSQWGEEILQIPTYAGHQSIPRGITMTWTSRAEPTFEEDAEEGMEIDAGDVATSRRRAARQGQNGSTASRDWDLLIASHSAELGGILKIWRFELKDTTITVPKIVTAYQTLTLRTPPTSVTFNTAQYPKRRHSQLLITDRSGLARIYDPFAPSSKRRKSAELGGYVALFRSTFEQPKSDTSASPILAARKPILDAAWAADGHSVIAVLADGEWGVWQVDRSDGSSSSDASAFTIRGFIGTQEGGRTSGSLSSPKKRSNQSALTPMTPNTRKSKEETLFQSVMSTSAAPIRGGISVASLQSSSTEAPEDAVLIWYGAELYRMPNFAQHLSRATSRSSGTTLSAPALSPVQGIALFGESITSIDQFDTTTREARLAVPRDILISAEHRLIVTTQTAEPLGRDLSAASAHDRAEEEEAQMMDQSLLARGELDLGGMDRLLDSMEGSVSASRSLAIGNPRKVLFASSTS